MLSVNVFGDSRETDANVVKLKSSPSNKIMVNLLLYYMTDFFFEQLRCLIKLVNCRLYWKFIGRCLGSQLLEL